MRHSLKQKGVAFIHIPMIILVVFIVTPMSFKLYELWVLHYKAERVAYFSATALANAEEDDYLVVHDDLHKISFNYLFKDKDVGFSFKSRKVKSGGVLQERETGMACKKNTTYESDLFVSESRFTTTLVQLCYEDPFSSSIIDVTKIYVSE